MFRYIFGVVVCTLIVVGAIATTPSAQPVAEYRIQFAYGRLMEAGDVSWMRQGEMDQMGWAETGGLKLPYRAPAGYRIGITQMCLASKMGDRASYLVIMGFYSHTDRAPCTTFTTPFWLKPGAELTGQIINNSGTRQWMIGTIQAVVVPIR